jgi:hypothetical protein
MNNEDKKYLKLLQEMSPKFETFEHMVRLLKKEQEEINNLFVAIDRNLVENYSTINN